MSSEDIIKTLQDQIAKLEEEKNNLSDKIDELAQNNKELEKKVETLESDLLAVDEEAITEKILNSQTSYHVEVSGRTYNIQNCSFNRRYRGFELTLSDDKTFENLFSPYIDEKNEALAEVETISKENGQLQNRITALEEAIDMIKITLP